VLGLAATVGWAFEIPYVDGTVGASELIAQGAFAGAVVGTVIGILLAFSPPTFLGKFQTLATSIIVSTVLLALLAHFTNRTLSGGETRTDHMLVKQVTKTWSGRGLSESNLTAPPDGYYVFIETPEGLLRLLSDGIEAPDVGPSRTVPVIVEPGYWGYPRYTLAASDAQTSWDD